MAAAPCEVTAQLPSPSKTEAYSLFEPQVIAFLKTHTPLREWVRAFAYVEFLPEEGHRLSACYPPDALSLDEAQRVTKLALPSGDKVAKTAVGRNSSFAFQIPGTALFGFSHFVVAPRGCHVREWTQNAVVVLTPLQHFDFFTSLAAAISVKLAVSSEPPEVTFSLIALAIALSWHSPPAVAPVSVSLRGPNLNFESVVPATQSHTSAENSHPPVVPPPQETSSNADTAAGDGDGDANGIAGDGDGDAGGSAGDGDLGGLGVDEFFSAEEDDDVTQPAPAKRPKPLRAEQQLEQRLRQNLAAKGFSGFCVSELSGRTKSEPLLIDPRFFGHSPEVSVFDSFREILPCLLVVWETMITAEPFLIFGQDASRVSRAVLAAKSLIAPLVYVGDCRPLVDTYEPDFDVLSSASKFLARYGSSAAEPRSPSSAQKSGLLALHKPGLSLRRIDGAIFGTTNPMVLNILASNVPAVLALSVPRNNVYVAPRVRAAQSFVVDRSAVSESASQPADIRQANNSFQVLFNSLITKAGVGASTSDFVYSDDQLDDSSPELLTYLLTARKSAFSSKEHALFSRTYTRGKTDLDTSLRRALYELTEDFLRPFQPYLTWDLRPLRLNPFQELAPPPILDPVEFLEQKDPSGVFELVSKTRLNRLYTLFIHTSTYQEWMKKELAERREAAQRSQLAFCLSVGPEIVQRLTVYELERAQTTVDALISKSDKKEHAAALERLLREIRGELKRRNVGLWR